jgi:hypothetical protein
VEQDGRQITVDGGKLQDLTDAPRMADAGSDNAEREFLTLLLLGSPLTGFVGNFRSAVLSGAVGRSDRDCSHADVRGRENRGSLANA